MARNVSAREGLFSDLNFTNVADIKPIQQVQPVQEEAPAEQEKPKKKVKSAEAPHRKPGAGRPRNPERNVKKSFYIQEKIFDALQLNHDCFAEKGRDFSKIVNEALNQYLEKELLVIDEVSEIQDPAKRKRAAMQKIMAMQSE